MAKTVSLSLNVMLGVQVVLAVILVAFLFWLSYTYVERNGTKDVDRRLDVPVRKRSCVVKGFLESQNAAKLVFNTVDPFSKTFVHLPIAYSRKGGITFSYMFWL